MQANSGARLNKGLTPWPPQVYNKQSQLLIREMKRSEETERSRDLLNVTSRMIGYALDIVLLYTESVPHSLLTSGSSICC